MTALRLAAAAALGALLVAGCGRDDGAAVREEPTPTPTASAGHALRDTTGPPPGGRLVVRAALST